MRTHACYDPFPQFSEGRTVTLSREESAHLSTVRRVRRGDLVSLFNGVGDVVEGELLDADRRGARIRMLRVVERQEPPSPARQLALALTKGDAFNAALRHGVELGATAIIPLMAAHSVVVLTEESVESKLARWRLMMIDALKQCERTWLPALSEPMLVEEALDPAPGMTILAAMEREDAAPLPSLREELRAQDVRILIGPEGGWSPEERTAILARARPVSLGPAILRAETAALAALAMLA